MLQHSAAAAPSARPRTIALARGQMLAGALGVLLISAVVYAVLRYPLAQVPLAALLAAYALLLWLRPEAWLVVVPLVVPAADLTPWSGWIAVQESDLFAALTIGLLLLKSPPRRDDFALGRPAAILLALLVATYLASVALGFHPLAGVPDRSDNIYLDRFNALRLAKGLAIPLGLLPYLGRAFRRDRQQAFRRFGIGMILGLAVVSAAALFERYVFAGVLSLNLPYRTVATFSSMHLGGGQLGAYLAMTLPFLANGISRPRRPLLILFTLGAAAIGGFALVTTFSRTDAVAALVAIMTLSTGYTLAATAAGKHQFKRLVALGGGILLALALAVTVWSSHYMRERLTLTGRDYLIRKENYESGLAVRERGWLADLLGAGLGSYPRIYAARNREGVKLASFALHREDGVPYLELSSTEPIYFGQKVGVAPHQTYYLSLAVRFRDATSELEIFLCEKWLLYSRRCDGGIVVPKTPGHWETYAVSIASGRIGDSGRGAWLRRPVDLAFSLEPDQQPVDIRDVSLIDATGQELVANGDFRAGTERWLITDDDHLFWRMHDQYLMLFFEQGWLGLAAFLTLAGFSLERAARACLAGEVAGAVIAASLAAFLVSGILDYLTEAPRLATLFYLICFASLCFSRSREAGPAEFAGSGNSAASADVTAADTAS